ncbi:MAG: Ppx/GppA family phosphatase [Parvularcula sp.]|jgi:exopolyphosphatase/guanosine-5'-triphosphate,3'-diphosphate pyrophosphatase|nr:Ppx/GppA family phosphatase [Parvularcula sp.]
MIQNVRWPRRAVVDIGSNSVRLVIFTGPPRVPLAMTNEKALCGLGDREPETGNLRPDAVERALQTLRRFKAVIDSEEPETLDVFATAAAREAPNGPQFLAEIEAIGLQPKVISGEEEARLAGLGILCSAPEIIREKTAAIGGDLGGGSLELSLLGAGGPGGVSKMVSLPAGSLRLKSDYGDDRKAAQKGIDKMLQDLPWLIENETNSLYVVGGSWRAIARVGMFLAEHPVPILDHYTMTAEQMLDVCRYVVDADPEDLGKISGVQKKRVPTLPMAAIVLRRLIELSSVERVVISSCGVREGILFDRLPARLQRAEPLFALAEDWADRLGAGRPVKPEAVRLFTDPLFDDDGTMQRLRYAAAIMIRTGNMSHPDERADHAAAVVMSTPFLGIDHIERSILALMMKARFGGSVTKAGGNVPLDVLSEKDILYAERVGLAHRFASSLRLPMFLKRSGFTLSKDDGKIVLSHEQGVADLVVETAVKDLEKLAASFDCKAEIRPI